MGWILLSQRWPGAHTRGHSGVIYADGGPDSDEVDAERAAEPDGLAQQVGLVPTKAAMPA